MLMKHFFSIFKTIVLNILVEMVIYFFQVSWNRKLKILFCKIVSTVKLIDQISVSLLNKENRNDPKLLKGSVYAVDFKVFLLEVHIC